MTKDTAVLLPHLTKLSVALERDSDLAEIAARVGCHTALKELRLESRSDTDIAIEFLQPTKYFPNLTHLWVSFLTIRCPPVQSPRGSGKKTYKDLKELRISGCVCIGDVGGLVDCLPAELQVLKFPRDVPVKMNSARKIVEKCRDSMRELRITSVPEVRF